MLPDLVSDLGQAGWAALLQTAGWTHVYSVGLSPSGTNSFPGHVLLTVTAETHVCAVCSVLGRCLTPATPWTVVALQAPLSMGFSRRDTGASCCFFLQGSFPTQGWNLCVLHLLPWQGDSLPQIHWDTPKTHTVNRNMLGPETLAETRLCPQSKASHAAIPSISGVEMRTLP